MISDIRHLSGCGVFTGSMSASETSCHGEYLAHGLSTKSVPEVETSSDFIAQLGKMFDTRTVADWSGQGLLELGFGTPGGKDPNGASPNSGEAW